MFGVLSGTPKAPRIAHLKAGITTNATAADLAGLPPTSGLPLRGARRDELVRPLQRPAVHARRSGRLNPDHRSRPEGARAASRSCCARGSGGK